MYKRIDVCVIGDGTHSKRLQKILKKKKFLFSVYKPISKKNFKIENINFLKNYKYIFIISPNSSHTHYIKLLHKKCFIFCEKPPTNNNKDLKILKKIKSNKIYFNYNHRFSKIAEILRNRNKYNLGEFVYGNIIFGHGLALKKEYKYNWRSKKINCPKGVFEMLSVHWIDLVNNIFNVYKFGKPKLTNLSNVGDTFDNSKVRLEIKKGRYLDIYCSYTSPVINKKIFVFKNGIIEQDETKVLIKGPSLNYDKKNFLKTPKIIESIKINESKDYILSLEKSVDFFFKNIKKKKFFSQKNYRQNLKINKMII